MTAGVGPPRRGATTPAPAAARPKQRRSALRKRLAREYAEAAVLALLAALVARATVVETFRIPSASMSPALAAGDRVLVSKLAYGVRLPIVDRWIVRWGEPRRGDVVVFEHPLHEGATYVKRVVGVPGDVVELREQVLYVNGVAQPRERVGVVDVDELSSASGAWWTERCTLWREQLARGGAPDDGAVAHGVLQCRDPAPREREGPFEAVKPGHLFVVGDSRDRSEDGRSDGGWQVPIGNVVGKAVRVLWSWGPDRARTGGGLRIRADRLFKAVE